MIEPRSYQQLKNDIARRMSEDRSVLDTLRQEVSPLKSDVRRIQPRLSTAISLVGTDGGNNSIQYDPFLVQLIRVVDSSNNEYCLEAITPTTDVVDLSHSQFGTDYRPQTALGYLMQYLQVDDLTALSHMIRDNGDGRPTSSSWVQVYRELVEWGILFRIVREKDFGTDTLIVFDGLLRSKVFARDLFRRYLVGLADAIEEQYRRSRRKLYLVGLAKHSKVLTRYRLAMQLEGVLATEYPSYVEIPREIEEKAYVWQEYARGSDIEVAGGELNKFVGGKMYFVKFGRRVTDPIWPVDIFQPQVKDASVVLGHLLADAENGFPVPFYPLCLQRAHENAALVDFDYTILQDHVLNGIRDILGDEGPVLDRALLQNDDPAQARYS